MRTPKLLPIAVLGLAVGLSSSAWAADPFEDCASRKLEGEAATACRDAASDAAYQARLSQSLFDIERVDEALEAARRSIGEFPTYGEGRRVLQQALVATGAVDEAIADYRTAQAEGVDDELALANDLAWYLYMAGHAEKALPLIEEWFAANPEPREELHGPASADLYPYHLGTLAHILAAVGRSEEAAERFMEAAELGGPEWKERYRRLLTDMGLDPGEDEEGLAEALRACAATGEACRLYSQE